MSEERFEYLKKELAENRILGEFFLYIVDTLLNIFQRLHPELRIWRWWFQKQMYFGWRRT